jgi:hypothetical protein
VAIGDQLPAGINFVRRSSLSIRSFPTVGYLECAGFALELEKVRQERALGQWVQLLGDVVVDPSD